MPPSDYPSGIDAFINPQSNDPLALPSHSDQHSNLNDAVEAIETELGTDPAGGFDTVKLRLDDIESDVDDLEGAVFDGGATDGQVLTSDGAGGAAFEDLPKGWEIIAEDDDASGAVAITNIGEYRALKLLISGFAGAETNRAAPLTWNSLSSYAVVGAQNNNGTLSSVEIHNAAECYLIPSGGTRKTVHAILDFFSDPVGARSIHASVSSHCENYDGSGTHHSGMQSHAVAGTGQITRIDFMGTGWVTSYTLIGLKD